VLLGTQNFMAVLPQGLPLLHDVVFHCKVKFPSNPTRDGVLFHAGGGYAANSRGVYVGIKGAGGSTPVFRVRVGSYGAIAVNAAPPDDDTLVLDIPLASLPQDGGRHQVVVEVRAAQPARARVWIDSVLRGQAFAQKGFGAPDGLGWATDGIAAFLMSKAALLPDGESASTWPGGESGSMGDDASDRLAVFPGARVPCGQSWARACGDSGDEPCVTYSETANEAFPASNAVDGDTATGYRAEGAPGSEPWWIMDLREERAVSTVRITHYDDVGTSWGQDMRVYAGGKTMDETTLCTGPRTTTTGAPYVMDVTCDRLAAKYVFVKAPAGGDALAFRELEVLGPRCGTGERRSGLGCEACPLGTFLRADSLSCEMCPGNATTFENGTTSELGCMCLASAGSLGASVQAWFSYPSAHTTSPVDLDNVTFAFDALNRPDAERAAQRLVALKSGWTRESAAVNWLTQDYGLGPATVGMWAVPLFRHYRSRLQGAWPASVVIEDRNPFELPDAGAIDAVLSRKTYWGMRVFGFVDVPASGEYLFQISGEDAITIWVDGIQALSQGGRHAPPQRSHEGSLIYLTKGLHSVALECAKFGGSTAECVARMKLASDSTGAFAPMSFLSPSLLADGGTEWAATAGMAYSSPGGWRGWLYIPPGIHNGPKMSFKCVGVKHCSLWVDEVLVIDNDSAEVDAAAIVPAGFHSVRVEFPAALGQASCAPFCPDGHAQRAAGACEPCPPGTFLGPEVARGEDGSIPSCAACPPWYTTVAAGSRYLSQCSECTPDAFRAGGACVPCDADPEYAVIGGRCVPAFKGTRSRFDYGATAPGEYLTPTNYIAPTPRDILSYPEFTTGKFGDGRQTRENAVFACKVKFPDIAVLKSEGKDVGDLNGHLFFFGNKIKSGVYVGFQGGRLLAQAGAAMGYIPSGEEGLHPDRLFASADPALLSSFLDGADHWVTLEIKVAAPSRITLIIDEVPVARAFASGSLVQVGWASQGVGWYVKFWDQSKGPEFLPGSYSGGNWPGGTIEQSGRLYFYEGAQVPYSVNWARSCGRNGTDPCPATGPLASGEANLVGAVATLAAVTDGVVATNFSTAYTFFESNKSAAGEQDAWTIDLEESRSIGRVRVWGRSDCCHMDGYVVYIANRSDVSSMVECQRRNGSNGTDGLNGMWYTDLVCNHEARFVTVKAQNSTHTKLSLAEVEVWSRRCQPGARPVGESCELCEKGTYLDDEALNCVTCPGNATTSGPGATSRLDCFCDPETGATPIKMPPGEMFVQEPGGQIQDLYDFTFHIQHDQDAPEPDFPRNSMHISPVFRHPVYEHFGVSGYLQMHWQEPDALQWISQKKQKGRSSNGVVNSPAIDVSVVPPIQQGLVQYWSSQYKAYFFIENPGTYLFECQADDECAIWVDSQLITEQHGLSGPMAAVGWVFLTRGYHHYRLELIQAGGGRNLRAYFAGPDTKGLRKPPNFISGGFKGGGWLSTDSGAEINTAPGLLGSSRRGGGFQGSFYVGGAAEGVYTFHATRNGTTLLVDSMVLMENAAADSTATVNLESDFHTIHVYYPNADWCVACGPLHFANVSARQCQSCPLGADVTSKPGGTPTYCPVCTDDYFANPDVDTLECLPIQTTTTTPEPTTTTTTPEPTTTTTTTPEPTTTTTTTPEPTTTTTTPTPEETTVETTEEVTPEETSTTVEPADDAPTSTSTTEAAVPETTTTTPTPPTSTSTAAAETSTTASVAATSPAPEETTTTTTPTPESPNPSSLYVEMQVRLAYTLAQFEPAKQQSFKKGVAAAANVAAASNVDEDKVEITKIAEATTRRAAQRRLLASTVEVDFRIIVQSNATATSLARNLDAAMLNTALAQWGVSPATITEAATVAAPSPAPPTTATAPTPVETTTTTSPAPELTVTTTPRPACADGLVATLGGGCSSPAVVWIQNVQPSSCDWAGGDKVLRPQAPACTRAELAHKESGGGRRAAPRAPCRGCGPAARARAPAERAAGPGDAVGPGCGARRPGDAPGVGRCRGLPGPRRHLLWCRRRGVGAPPFLTHARALGAQVLAAAFAVRFGGMAPRAGLGVPVPVERISDSVRGISPSPPLPPPTARPTVWMRLQGPAPLCAGHWAAQARGLHAGAALAALAASGASALAWGNGSKGCVRVAPCDTDSL